MKEVFTNLAFDVVELLSWPDVNVFSALCTVDMRNQTRTKRGVIIHNPKGDVMSNYKCVTTLVFFYTVVEVYQVTVNNAVRC